MAKMVSRCGSSFRKEIEFSIKIASRDKELLDPERKFPLLWGSLSFDFFKVEDRLLTGGSFAIKVLHSDAKKESAGQ